MKNINSKVSLLKRCNRCLINGNENYVVNSMKMNGNRNILSIPSSITSLKIMNKIGNRDLNYSFRYISSSSASAAQRDLYEILGVDRSSDKKTIKKKYFELAKKYHPDQNPNNAEATKKFQEVSQAYEVLGDDEKRKRYDQFGFRGVQDDASAENAQAQNARAEEIFRNMMSEMFGGGGGRPFSGFEGMFGNGKSEQVNGDDISLRMKISFDEAARGASKTVEYETLKSCSPCKGTGSASSGKPEYSNCSSCKGTGYKVTARRSPLGLMQVQSVCDVCHGQGKKLKNPCNTCGGEGRTQGKVERNINIPSGIESGQTVRILGGGEAGARGTKSGDLFVSIEVVESKEFKRSGSNVTSDIKVPLSIALLGGTAKVKGVLGESFEVKVPNGTNTGDILRLRKKGIPIINGGGNRGDHMVQFIIDIPSSLNDRQKQIIKEFQDEEDKKQGIFNQNKKPESTNEKSDSLKSESDINKKSHDRPTA